MTGRGARAADVAHGTHSGAPPTAMRALMAGAIDYAGLFPPAALAMPEAVRRYGVHRRGPHAWMLGRFIVPVARLEEFAAAFAAAHDRALDSASPWPIAVIARASDAATLAAFNAQYGSRVRIDTVETPLLHAADVTELAAAAELPALGELPALVALAQSYTVFAEVGWATDPVPLIGALARHGVRAKLRTGGVTAEVFPPADAVARFILACREARVPFKATAGLHHAWRAAYPLTYEPLSARATMHGFLNVLLASAAAIGGADAAELATILAATDGTGFMVEDRGVVLPSGRAVPAELVSAMRAAALTSFGSCSFEEPVAELTERGFL